MFRQMFLLAFLAVLLSLVGAQDVNPFSAAGDGSGSSGGGGGNFGTASVGSSGSGGSTGGGFGTASLGGNFFRDLGSFARRFLNRGVSQSNPNQGSQPRTPVVVVTQQPPQPRVPAETANSCAGTGFVCSGSDTSLSQRALSSLPQTGDSTGLQSSVQREVNEENEAAARANPASNSGFRPSSNGGGGGGGIVSQPTCESEARLIVPTSGRNYRGRQRNVVQHRGRFSQFFKLRICKKANQGCGYNSRCVQEFNYQRVLVQDPESYRVFWDWFKIPTCCSCKAYSYGR